MLARSDRPSGARLQRVSVVILTCNRIDDLRRTLQHMLALPDAAPIVVVDNASTDGTPAVLRATFPTVQLVGLPRNIGAAGRNAGVAAVQTPYVAFCDDDSWWAPGSLAAGADLLDAHPTVAIDCARILLGREQAEDPLCATLAASPLPSAGLPGPALLGFVACAAILRRSAFIAAGGFEERFFVGGEEELLALDLVSLGWHVVYAAQLLIHHHPSPRRDNAARRRIVLRNRFWVAWLRLPAALAWRECRRGMRAAGNRAIALQAAIEALAELKWVVRQRRVITPEVLRLYRMLRD